MAKKAKEKKLVLMEERFCTWNDFKKKKPDVWLSEAGEPIEFAIRRMGMQNSELALFDGGRFYWIEKGRKFYFQAVTHWVQMPRLYCTQRKSFTARQRRQALALRGLIYPVE